MNLTKPLFFHRCVAALSAAAMLSVTGPVGAGSVAKAPLTDPVNEYHPMYFGTFNTGVKTSDVYTEGNISFVVPIWSSIGMDGTLGGGTVFLSPYVSLGEQGELATSLGLGWRYLFNDQPIGALKSNDRAGFLTEGFYVGANVFVDNLRTQFDNDFWQLGIGAEIGSRYLELRGNYYLPFSSGQKLAERTSSTEKFTSQSRSSSTRMEQDAAPLGDPFATGNTIQQDAYLTSTAVTSTRTTTTKTTVKTITSLFEEGMEGWDIEAAMLVPGVDQYLDVSLIAGYYSFDNQPFGPQRGGSGNTEGWKFGIEVRPVPALVLTATWYDDEGLTGSDWVAGVGLQIPLGKDWKDAFKSRRRHLAERLAEPVARQNAAIKTSRSVDVDQEVSQTSSTRTAVVRRVVSEGEGRITIKEDIIFVNNGGDVGNGIQEASPPNGDGTAENPFFDIQSGADLAATNSAVDQKIWTVYTQGDGAHGGGKYDDHVTISSSIKFTSSLIPIVSPIGGSFGTGDTPTVSGGFAANAADFISASTTPSVEIHGYEIMDGYDSSLTTSVNIPGGFSAADGDGIHLNNINQVAITTNNIHDIVIGNGAYLGGNLPGGHQILVADNVFNQTGGTGLELDFFGADVNANIINNSANSNATGIDIDLQNGNFTVVIDDNITNLNGGDGLVYYQDGTGDFVGSITNNAANLNGRFGLNIELDSGDFAGVIASNIVQRNVNDGIYLEIDAGDLTGSIIGNTSAQNLENGIQTYISGLYQGYTADNNSSGNNGHGIFIEQRGNGNFGGSIINNTAIGNDLSGIQMESRQGDFTGLVANNTVEDNNDGIFLRLTDGNINGSITGNMAMNNRVGLNIATAVGDFNGTISDNTVNESGGIGINLALFDGDFGAGGRITNNTANGNDTFGINVSLFAGDFAGIISGNTAGASLANSQLYGIYITSVGTGDFSGAISDNITNRNLIGGTTLLLQNGNFSGSIIGNTSNENEGSGINLNVIVGNSTGTVSSNTTNLNTEIGLSVNLGTGNLSGSITSNTANNNADSGVRLSVNGTFSGDFSGNSAMDNTNFGFDTGAVAVDPGAITSPNTATGNGINFGNLVFPQAIAQP